MTDAIVATNTTERAGLEPERGDVGDAQLATVVQYISIRLRQRYPEACPVALQHSIDHATKMFRNARVRQFLPILIERAASDALRTGSAI